MKFTTIYRNKEINRVKESLFYIKLDNLYTVIIKEDITDYNILDYNAYIIYKLNNTTDNTIYFINIGHSRIYLGISEYLRLIKKTIINNHSLTKSYQIIKYENYINISERHSKLKELMSII